MKRPKSRVSVLALAAVGLGAVAAAGLAFAARPGRNAHVPQPAKAVDIDRYAGRWFELGRYDNRFEHDCEGVTADYAKRSDGLIEVINTCHDKAPDGPTRTSRGRAKIVPGSNGAKLKVSFFGPFFVGDYWVLDHADDYAWSIVGGGSGRFLWLLSRVPAPPAAFRADLIRRAAALGYDPAAIRETRQLPP
ncbi:MAG: lipocalin family protein [Caulobacteraceae bacterium]